jgi:methylisocitrate lyase
MADRVKAAVDAKTDDDFFLVARTDAIATEGVDAAIERSLACVEAGADGIFAEAARDLATYIKFADAVKVPVLANMTEFGETPLFTLEELREAGVRMVLYPLSAFRAMNKAAETVYRAIRRDGHQKNVIALMQTRDELYESIGYLEYERKLDVLFAAKTGRTRER